MQSLKSGFIGRFHCGDNIAFNLEILGELYSTGLNQKPKPILYKPCIVTMVSIVEAILFDLHHRMKWNRKEGVAGLSQKVLSYIRGKQIDRFESLLASCKKHNILNNQFIDLYQELDTLRKARNRIHIQDEKRILEKYEKDVFTRDRLIASERSLEATIKIIKKNHSREDYLHHTPNFDLPWKEHFTNI